MNSKLPQLKYYISIDGAIIELDFIQIMTYLDSYIPSSLEDEDEIMKALNLITGFARLVEIAIDLKRRKELKN